MKKKRRIFGTAVTAGILALCLGGFALTGKASEREKSSGENISVEITAGKNEELVYASLTKVVGNEITCVLSDSGEEKEYEIPVGTVVTTRLGTQTTFVRLSEGNQVALLLEKGTEVIKAVWIVE